MHWLPLFNFFIHFKQRFMNKIFLYVLSISAMLVIIIACGSNDTKTTESKKDSTTATTAKKDSVEDESDKPPVSNDVQLKLPAGFTAVEVTPGIGTARHLVVTSNGIIYVKMSKANENKGILILKDKNGDGIADETTGFGDFGGTGIAVKNGYLYASSNTEIFLTSSMKIMK